MTVIGQRDNFSFDLLCVRGILVLQSCKFEHPIKVNVYKTGSILFKECSVHTPIHIEIQNGGQWSFTQGRHLDDYFHVQWIPEDGLFSENTIL